MRGIVFGIVAFVALVGMPVVTHAEAMQAISHKGWMSPSPHLHLPNISPELYAQRGCTPGANALPDIESLKSVDSLTGCVTDQSGRPLAGFGWGIGPADPEGTIAGIASYSPEPGRFVQPFLYAGKYRVSVSSEGYKPQSRVVTVTGDGPEIVDFVLEREGDSNEPSVTPEATVILPVEETPTLPTEPEPTAVVPTEPPEVGSGGAMGSGPVLFVAASATLLLLLTVGSYVLRRRHRDAA